MKGYGETLAREIDGRVHAFAATTTALGAIPAADRYDGQTCHVAADGSRWAYSAASTATDATSLVVVTPADAPTAGRWLRMDKMFDLKLAIGFATADAAVLFAVPAGFKFRLVRGLWEVTTPWTGGASSAIGLSSGNAAYNTKGDLLGGATGDVAATLIVVSPGPYVGTIGAKGASGGVVVLVAGDTVRFDRITSAFTAGAGFAHLCLDVLA